MIKDKISSQEIIDLVSSKAVVSKRAAEEFLKVMISTIEDALIAGESVKIKNLGTFKLQWNEPRKSVNIQTGAEIILDGYYKVSFTPDVILKDLVNEPFAHLEPIVLEQENIEPIQEDTDVALDPLRIFTEQASEIKDLISEIQSLSPKSKSVVKPIAKPIVRTIVDEQKVEIKIEAERIEIKPEEVAKIEEIEELAAPVLEYIAEKKTESVIVHQEQMILRDKDGSYTASDEAAEFGSSPFLDDYKYKKKPKVWIWILLAIILLSGAGSGLCLLYPPAMDFTQSTLNNCITGMVKITGNISNSGMFKTVNGWFVSTPQKSEMTQSIVIPKDTTDDDSISSIKPIDSLQVMFDNPRVYTKFIASERIRGGSRLTLMSKRYYGSKDFWVYIYEANKVKILNPDNIAKGTLIRIPKLDPRLIDAANPRCVKKALELHDLYVK